MAKLLQHGYSYFSYLCDTLCFSPRFVITDQIKIISEAETQCNMLERFTSVQLHLCISVTAWRQKRFTVNLVIGVMPFFFSQLLTSAIHLPRQKQQQHLPRFITLGEMINKHQCVWTGNADASVSFDEKAYFDVTYRPSGLRLRSQPPARRLSLLCSTLIPWNESLWIQKQGKCMRKGAFTSTLSLLFT